MAEVNAEIFWSRVEILGTDDCWRWLGVYGRRGYGAYSHRLAHRVAWEITFGPTELYVLHKCDNPACCNPQHLFEGTQADNVADMTVKGRNFVGTGETNPRAKLTESDVIRIRQLHGEGITGAALAGMYNVSTGIIYNIIQRRNWRHL